ncbi:MAG: FGGY-family carbohydrate kinase [Thermoguttaceae bacterium]
MAQYLLGIDAGSTMTKTALFTTDGTEMAVSAFRPDLIEVHPGWSERNDDRLWEDTARAIRNVLAKSGIAPCEIACVACTGYGNGLHLVDAAGDPVRNGINSMDTRARCCVDRWLADGVHRQALPKTAQSLWPGQPNALLRWLRDHEPESLKKASWALLCKDYIRSRLCGKIHAELSDMSATSLMSVVDARYDDGVLELFGIADLRRLLPPLVRSADICGAISAQTAAQTGLAPGTPVAAGMFDIDACALASGIVDGGPMSIVAGTWGCHQYIAREPLVDPELFMTSCYSMPGWYLMLEGSPTSACNLDWFVKEFLAADAAAAAPAGSSDFERCEQMAASVQPQAADPVFLPFLYGSNATPDARGSLVGLQGRHHRGHVARAVYEGIVFAHQTHLLRLLRHRPAPTSIRFAGGAARSAFWAQMFADGFQIPIEIPAGTELGALGAAIAAAVACGLYGDFPTAVAAMTHIARRYEPELTKREMYASKRRRYELAVDALTPIWKEFL